VPLNGGSQGVSKRVLAHGTERTCGSGRAASGAAPSKPYADLVTDPRRTAEDLQHLESTLEHPAVVKKLFSVALGVLTAIGGFVCGSG
jgi:hypothetical protein